MESTIVITVSNSVNFRSSTTKLILPVSYFVFSIVDIILLETDVHTQITDTNILPYIS